LDLQKLALNRYFLSSVIKNCWQHCRKPSNLVKRFKKISRNSKTKRKTKLNRKRNCKLKWVALAHHINFIVRLTKVAKRSSIRF